MRLFRAIIFSVISLLQPPTPANHFPEKCIFYLDTSFLFISLRLVAVITSLGHVQIRQMESKQDAVHTPPPVAHSHPTPSHLVPFSTWSSFPGTDVNLTGDEIGDGVGEGNGFILFLSNRVF